MQIVLLVVGKRSREGVDHLVDDYLARLSRTVKSELVFLPGSSLGDATKIKAEEAKAIVDFVRDRDMLILLDERGKERTSLALSEDLERWLTLGKQRIVFLIGGAYGVSDEVRQRAAAEWSLSQLTLPHELARLLCAEALYRAASILRNEPYHHR